MKTTIACHNLTTRVNINLPKQTNEHVAIKRLEMGMKGIDWKRELGLLRTIKHCHIVRFRDFKLSARAAYLVSANFVISSSCFDRPSSPDIYTLCQTNEMFGVLCMFQVVNNNNNNIRS